MSWRAIHDSVAASESLAAVSHGAERLYWRLLSQTDSYGRLRGEPAKVRATCMPLLPVTDEEINDCLGELEQVGRVIRYTVDGRGYIQITDFDLNQPTEFLRRRGKEQYPAPNRANSRTTPDYSRTTPGVTKTHQLAGNSRTTPDQSGSTQDHSGVEVEAEAEEKGPSSSSSTEDRKLDLPFDLELGKTKLRAALNNPGNGPMAALESYGLPPAAWHAAAEELQRMNGIREPIAYTVGLFKSWKAEGRYA